jgi:SAM-dependent methyltransferase
MKREVDLGCGAVRRAPGAIRADISRDVHPDVLVNAAGGLPFRTGSLARVWCFDLVEHMPDIPALLREVHRVLEPGGSIVLTTPHFSCANSWTDPTHQQHLGWRSFDYFTAEHDLRYYSTARFRIRRRVLRFHGGPVDAVIRRVAERWPDFYEHRLAWMFPAWYLEFELVKDREEAPPRLPRAKSRGAERGGKGPSRAREGLPAHRSDQFFSP